MDASSRSRPDISGMTEAIDLGSWIQLKKRRVVVVAVSIVMVAIVLALLSQPILNSRIKARIVVAAQKALHVDPTVKLGSGIAALELLNRRITQFEVSTNSYSTTRISNIGLVASFSGVTLPHGTTCATAKSVNVSASIGANYISKQMTARFKSQAGLTVSKVVHDQGGINVEAGPGGVATIILTPTTSGSNLVLTVKSILLFGQPLAPSRVASIAGKVHPVVPINQVPSYLHLKSVKTSTTALTLYFEGSNAVLHQGSRCIS